jgi:hypothetical protein
MVSDILLDKSMTVVAADDGIGQIEILDDCLQLAAIAGSNFAAEDDGDLVGLTQGAISRTRSPSLSRAARRWKMRLSQYST